MLPGERRKNQHAGVHAPGKRTAGGEDTAVHVPRRARVLPGLVAHVGTSCAFPKCRLHVCPYKTLTTFCVTIQVIGSMEYDTPLHPAAELININERIMKMYVDDLLPALCETGDDNNYGSTGLADVTNLQTISKRIHYGKFVAESKFQARSEEFSALIKAQDAAGLMELLTFKAVEDRVVRRVTNKAATYGQDISEDLPDGAAKLGEGPDLVYKVKPSQIGELYRKWIMPMTKDVQVEYLLRRLD